FSSRRRHTRSKRDWSSDVCSSDLSRRKRAARNRGSQAQPAIPKVKRLTDRAISWRGENAGSDGALPGRGGPRLATGGVGTRRPPAIAGGRPVRAAVRPARQTARANREERRLRRLPRVRLSGQMPVRLNAGGLPELS